MAIDCTQTHLNKLCPTQRYAQATGVGQFAHYLDIQCQKKERRKRKLAHVASDHFIKEKKYLNTHTHTGLCKGYCTESSGCPVLL